MKVIDIQNYYVHINYSWNYINTTYFYLLAVVDKNQWSQKVRKYDIKLDCAYNIWKTSSGAYGGHVSVKKVCDRNKEKF